MSTRVGYCSACIRLVLLFLGLCALCSSGCSVQNPQEPNQTQESGPLDAGTNTEHTPNDQADAGTNTEPTPNDQANTESSPEQQTQDANQPETSGPMACNGSPALCDKTFNNVAYPTTHNAMSNSVDGWLPPNQGSPISQQLKDGIRGLMLDTHMDQGEAYLCHGSCALGKKKLVDGLAEITQFLENHPHEVITIIFESYISAKVTHQAFVDSKLLPLVHSQDVKQPWPTLRSMIQANHRVVVLTDKEGGTYPWYHNVWKYAWDTEWSVSSKEDFNCKRKRGSTQNKLFILNHFISTPLPSPKNAKEANTNPFFLTRVQQCHQETKQLPNFITVDFYNIGDLFQVVATMNQ